MDAQTLAATTGNMGVGDGDVRPLKTPSDGRRMSEVGLTTSGDFNNALSPLQK